MLITSPQSQDSANEVEDFESGDDVDGSPGRATIKAKWTKVFWIIIIAIQIIHPCQKKSRTRCFGFLALLGALYLTLASQ